MAKYSKKAGEKVEKAMHRRSKYLGPLSIFFLLLKDPIRHLKHQLANHIDHLHPVEEILQSNYKNKWHVY